MIDEKDFKLPMIRKPKNKWVPIPRRSKHTPFGYEEDPNDEDILLPIPLELELLEEAKQHLKKYSYRAVAAWLSEASGRYISHMGLKQRLTNERRNKQKAQGYYLEAERLAKVLKKLKELETQRTGSTSTRSRADDFDPSLTETG